ncbi:MAG: hypothetical protein PVF91_13290 [Chromatiales bacterium]|jgi:hypothetical protein
MKKLAKQLTAGALAMVVVAPAFADDDFGRWLVDRRHDIQRERIKQGWREGDITWREGAGLIGDRLRINRMRRDFLDNGYLSPEERRALNRAYNDSSVRIYDYKHNPDHRDGGYYGGYYGDPYRYRYYDDRRYRGYRW